MPKRVAIGVVTADGASKTRRVELPRLVQHARYSKFIKRRTVCHVHDEQNESKVGDTVEIKECPPRSKLKRWELVRVVQRSNAVDVEALRAAHKKRGHDAKQTHTEEAQQETETTASQ